MKRILSVMLAVLMLFSCMTFAASAEEVAAVTVTLNGEVVDCAAYGQPATIVEGRTLVPLRAIFEALGATVEWDQATKTVSSELDGTAIKLTIGENTLYKNDEAITIDVAAMIMNGRTLVPARAIAEAYGVDVAWDSATRTVILTQAVKEEVEELPEGTFFVLTGENYTGEEGYKFTSGTSIVPEVVDDFANADNKVLFLHSEYTEKQAWTYFRNETSVKYKAGERYLIKFKASPELTSADDSVEVAYVGICARFADSAEDGSFKDHGIGTVNAFPGKWTEVYFVYTMPETFIEEKGSGFGIFANPVNGLPMSIYLDDISVSVYDGPAADGLQSADSMKAAEVKETFNIDEAKGVVFDFDDDYDLSQATASEKYVEDGALVMVAADDFHDPQFYYRNVSYAADDYNAIAIRFKAENSGTSENAKATTFQIYFTTDTQDSASESKSCSAKYEECIKDGDWYVAYIVMSGNENWNGNITMLRFDPANDSGKFTVDKIVLIEA